MPFVRTVCPWHVSLPGSWVFRLATALGFPLESPFSRATCPAIQVLGLRPAGVRGRYRKHRYDQKTCYFLTNVPTCCIYLHASMLGSQRVIYLYIFAHMCVLYTVYTDIYVYVYAYVHVCMHERVLIALYTHIQQTYTYIRLQTHTHVLRHA